MEVVPAEAACARGREKGGRGLTVGRGRGGMGVLGARDDLLRKESLWELRVDLDRRVQALALHLDAFVTR